MNKWKFDELVMATGNKGKLRELSRLLEPSASRCCRRPTAGWKALRWRRRGRPLSKTPSSRRWPTAGRRLPSVADDSGLCVDALSGAPGVYSARFGGEGLTDRQRTELLLEKMKDVPMEKRGAHFTSAVALALPTATALWCRASATGWWPCAFGRRGLWLRLRLFYAPEGCTFADMSEQVKNRVSHRAVAMRLLVEQLERSAKDAEQ